MYPEGISKLNLSNSIISPIVHTLKEGAFACAPC